MSLAPPPIKAWPDLPTVWQRWFQALFANVGGSTAGLLAPLASPTFTGNPRAPTPPVDDNDTSIATTAFVRGQVASKAPLASPAFTGTPTAPTPAASDNSTKIATTAFVAAATTTVTPATATAATGWAINSQQLERSADGIVTFALKGTRTGTTGSSVAVATIPAGLWPAQALVPIGGMRDSDGTARSASVASDGTVTIYGGVVDANAYHFAGSWKAA